MITPRKLWVAGLAACTALFTSIAAHAAIFVKIPNIDGEVLGPDGEYDWFVADSFSFGVEREMKESGEKGGTQDLNIGVGELQECTISKSMDVASAKLAQLAINGNSPGQVQVCFVNDSEDDGGTSTSAESRPVCYLKYKLDRAFVKSWSTSGDADDRPTEEVAFYFNKIAYGQSVETSDGRIQIDEMSWDRWKRTDWTAGLRDIQDGLGGTPPDRPPSCDIR